MNEPVPIPIGLMTILQVVNVDFVSLRGPPSERWPYGEIEYQHNERMIAWRPRELHEFLKELIDFDRNPRMLGRNESDA